MLADARRKLGQRSGATGVATDRLSKIQASVLRHLDEHDDKVGEAEDVAAALRDEKVSVEAMIQRGRNPDDVVPVVLTTHETEEAALLRALERMARLAAVLETPRLIRIERF